MGTVVANKALEVRYHLEKIATNAPQNSDDTSWWLDHARLFVVRRWPNLKLELQEEIAHRAVSDFASRARPVNSNV
jgi:hypothetical protein